MYMYGDRCRVRVEELPRQHTPHQVPPPHTPPLQPPGPATRCSFSLPHACFSTPVGGGLRIHPENARKSSRQGVQ